MSEWKCGKCGKEYSFEEFRQLPVIRVKTEKEDPKCDYGKTTVCYNCGYVFHRDKFKIRDTIEISFDGKKKKIDVSTVFLELNHFGYWYETLVFPESGVNCDYGNRFKTKEEAEENHKKIVSKLKKGEFKIEISEHRLIMGGDEK